MLMEIRSRKFPRERMREITVKYRIDNTGVIKEKTEIRLHTATRIALSREKDKSR